MNPVNRQWRYGNIQKASATFNLLVQKDGGIFGEISKVWLAALQKNKDDFTAQVSILKEYGSRDKELSWWLADCYMLMGNTDKAFFWMLC